MLRRSFRMLVMITALAAAIATTAVSPASAAGAGVFVFSAPATVSNQIFAPVGVLNPNCGNPGVPGVVGVCPGGAGTFAFSTANATSVCVGAAADVSATAVGAGIAVNGSGVAGTSCALSASGSVNAVAGFGPWCGLSSGSGTSSASVSTGLLPGVSASANVEWLASAGTILPLIFTGGATGVGAVQTTGPNPGPCGLAAAGGNPSGATTFQVTGFAALVTVP